jgi:hypothetical protein
MLGVFPTPNDESMLLKEEHLKDSIPVDDPDTSGEPATPPIDHMLSGKAEDPELGSKAPEMHCFTRSNEPQAHTDRQLEEPLPEGFLLTGVAIGSPSLSREVLWGLEGSDADGDLCIDQDRPMSSGYLVKEPLNPLWWEEAARRRFECRPDSFPAEPSNVSHHRWALGPLQE